MCVCVCMITLIHTTCMHIYTYMHTKYLSEAMQVEFLPGRQMTYGVVDHHFSIFPEYTEGSDGTTYTVLNFWFNVSECRKTVFRDKYILQN